MSTCSWLAKSANLQGGVEKHDLAAEAVGNVGHVMTSKNPPAW